VSDHAAANGPRRLRVAHWTKLLLYPQTQPATQLIFSRAWVQLASSAVLGELFRACLGVVRDFLVSAWGQTPISKCLKCPDFLLPLHYSGEVLLAKFALVYLQIPNQVLISIKILPV